MPRWGAGAPTRATSLTPYSLNPWVRIVWRDALTDWA